MAQLFSQVGTEMNDADRRTSDTVTVEAYGTFPRADVDAVLDVLHRYRTRRGKDFNETDAVSLLANLAATSERYLPMEGDKTNG